MKNLRTLLLLSAILFFGKLSAQTWTPHATGTLNDIYDVSFPTIDSGYAVDGMGNIYKTFDGAITWSTFTAPTPCYPIFFVSGMKGCVGADSLIYRTTNAGSSWTTTLNDNQVSFYSIYFVDDLNGFAGGIKLDFDSLRLYKTTNGGISWSLANTVGSYIPDQAFYFFNSTTGFWANNSKILATTNAGTSFNMVYNDITQMDFIVNISFPNIDTGYAVGYLSLIKSIDGGANWNQITYPGTANYDVHFFDGQKGFVCGGNGFNSGYVLQTSNGGGSWTPIYSSVYTFGCMDFPADTIGYAGGQNGIVLSYSGSPNGISENTNANQINVFPNPTTNSVQINNLTSGAKVQLLNLSGQILKDETAENSTMKMNLENLSSGIYFLKINNGENVSVKKIVKN